MTGFFKDASGLKSETDVLEHLGDTFMFADHLAQQSGATPAGTRLFVGGLSMNPIRNQPEVGDEVLVVFENGPKNTHPDFLWAPHDWVI
jgi:hypothetical protein